MTFWGYSISEARVINYDQNDRALAEQVAEQAPDSKLCIGCGGCTAGCTTGNLTDFNIRKLQMLMKRGENEQIRENLHKCMLCGKCLLVCPRGIDIRKMILAILEYQKRQ